MTGRNITYLPVLLLFFFFFFFFLLLLLFFALIISKKSKAKSIPFVTKNLIPPVSVLYIFPFQPLPKMEKLPGSYIYESAAGEFLLCMYVNKNN